MQRILSVYNFSSRWTNTALPVRVTASNFLLREPSDVTSADCLPVNYSSHGIVHASSQYVIPHCFINSSMQLSFRPVPIKTPNEASVFKTGCNIGSRNPAPDMSRVLSLECYLIAIFSGNDKSQREMCILIGPTLEANCTVFTVTLDLF